MENDLQVWQLILEASGMGKGVMLILLLASVSSWMIIFRKRMTLAAAEKGADTFEERFWSGTDLTQLYELVSRNPVHRHRVSYRVLLRYCRLIISKRYLIIFQVYDVKVVHFKTSLEYHPVEIFHFADCNQGHDVSPLGTRCAICTSATGTQRRRRRR